MNLNSLAKDNFHRVSLIVAHNSCFNYEKQEKTRKNKKKQEEENKKKKKKKKKEKKRKKKERKKKNYDLISICETSLNDSVNLPKTLPVNNPTNTRRGGVGLFYKNSLSLIIRNDLSFDESIVVEVKFGRKKIFFTVLYRSPATDHNSPKFQAFLTDFRNLYAKIKAEKILLRHFLKETLMPILNIGGRTATQLLKARKLNINCHL